MNGAGLEVFLLAELLVLAGAYAACLDRFFTVGDMHSRGLSKGIPFIAHGGMWGDLLWISPLLGIIVSRFGSQWSVMEILVVCAMGFSGSAIMHLSYVKTDLPEAHTHDHKLTTAGWIHVVYMGTAFSILILLFFFTRGVSQRFAGITYFVLTLHMFVGTHIPLWFANPEWYGGQTWRRLFEAVGTVAGTAILVGIACHFMLGR